ncbi:hypothetical protein [Rhodococcoides fascians]|uniref:hypothetical protein n=1 Tax=Rhodococcoides fascians TaxID=1828 RepID=UPI000A8FBBF2|nr:hypothetical protein [Rhodococcus fascians]
MSDVDIVDRIDALVDEQLANYDNRSGYDHDVNQERCRCGRDWHGLPITKRIDGMRSFGEFDPGYVYAEDDSPVMCVGSNTPGPWRQVGMWQLPDYPFDDMGWLDDSMARTFSSSAVTSYMNRIRERMDSDFQMPGRHEIADGRPYMVDRDFQLARGEQVGWDNGDGVVHLGRVESHEPDGHGGWTITVGPDPAQVAAALPSAREMIHAAITFFDGITESVTTAAEAIRSGFAGLGAQLDAEPDTRTPQQRALPRPSTTPPMWANDVTRSRRPRRNRNQPNRQGIA